MRKQILVIEDDKEISTIIHSYLSKEGYEILNVYNGKKGLELFQERQSIDLIILDIMLPDLDGWSICRKIRKTSTVPIIILTARDDEEDELYGFELKANDYIKKPFSPKVLVARVATLLDSNKSEINDNVDRLIKKGVLTLIPESFKAEVDGITIDLTKKEFLILYLLASNEKIVFSREQILTNVWSFEYNTESRLVDNHIKNIRKSLGDHFYYISTVFGIGYKFEVK